jgi:hypothetical protein
MDDMERWAALVPPAADSTRVAKEARELQLKTALSVIADHIKERRAAGHNHAYIRGLDIQGQYLKEVIAVLEHQGYKLTSLSTRPTEDIADLALEWRDAPDARPAVPRVVCGLELYGTGCSRPFCDLPRGHPGRCEANTLSQPRCGASYEYREQGTACKAPCGMPWNHRGSHYSIDELNGLPGPARD